MNKDILYMEAAEHAGAPTPHYRIPEPLEGDILRARRASLIAGRKEERETAGSKVRAATGNLGLLCNGRRTLGCGARSRDGGIDAGEDLGGSAPELRSLP